MSKRGLDARVHFWKLHVVVSQQDFEAVAKREPIASVPVAVASSGKTDATCNRQNSASSVTTTLVFRGHRCFSHAITLLGYTSSM